MIAPTRPAARLPQSRYAGHDAVLADLAGYGPSLDNGLFNHAPMVAEALCALGAPEQAPPWLAAHRRELAPRPPRQAPLDAEAWRAALGRPERFADFAALIRSELGERPWPTVLDAWAARLAPGFASAACHGAIRTGHAARALADAVTPARLDELADALAAWAALYETLPVRARANPPLRPPRKVLRDLEPVPAQHRPPAGMITTGLLSLRHAPHFARQVGSADLFGDPAHPTYQAPGAVRARLDELILLFAEVFCASADSAFTAVVFTHAVTGCAAVRNIEPHVGRATAQALGERAWEAGCALQAAFGRPLSGERVSAEAADADRLIAAALQHGDDHVIKLTEACLAAWRRRADPVLPAAAALAQRLIPA